MSSSSSMPNSEILIVGAGPSGLVLALSLARSGVPVRIIEKSKTHRVGQRGSGITPRSQELFEALGIVDEIKRRAIDFPIFRMYKMPEGIDVIKEFYVTKKRLSTPAFPYVNSLMLGQDTLEGLLRAELEKLGVVVELSRELVSLQQTNDDTIEVKILKKDSSGSTSDSTVELSSYRWVVGADGARSAVRKQLGLTFLGKTHIETFIVGDIKLEGLQENTWNLWGDMNHIMTGIRATETPGLFSLLVGGSGLNLDEGSDIWTNEDALRTFLKNGTGNREDIKFGDVVWVGPYRLNIRCVEAFKKGSVFIIGGASYSPNCTLITTHSRLLTTIVDAAHVHGPAGGQGMNTSIQDAFNLGWKLSLVAKGLAPISLLNSFNEERLPVVKEMLNITDNLMKKTISDSNTEEGWDRSGSIDQLGVNYRGSSILVDEEDEELGCAGRNISPYDAAPGGTVHAGDRAPDAPGLVKLGSDCSEEPARLFEQFDLSRHLILLFSDTADDKVAIDILDMKARAPDVLKTVVISSTGLKVSFNADEMFEDLHGHARNAYLGLHGKSSVFVIRPDGIVGARVKSISGLERYFKHVLKI